MKFYKTNLIKMKQDDQELRTYFLKEQDGIYYHKATFRFSVSYHVNKQHYRIAKRRDLNYQ